VKDCLSPILAKKQNVLVPRLSHRNINENFLGEKPLNILKFLCSSLLMFCSNHNMKDVPQGTEHDSRVVRFNIESKDQNPSFKDLIRSDASENLEGTEAQIPQEPSAQWDTEGSPNLASGLDDANPPYPYLPTVLEEPSSSFSEGVAS